MILKSTRKMAFVLSLMLIVSTAAALAQAKIYYAKEMTTEDYKKLDRSKTAVFLCVSVLEEHGPYVPAYTDGYITERIISDVSAAMVRKGWSALVFPMIPVASSACNEVPGKYPFPGSFTIRAYTFRSMLMDLVSEIGEAGFRWIFVGNDHGAPNHVRMLSQVCAYFNDTYSGGRMTVIGLSGASSNPEISKLNEEAQALLSAEAKKEDANGGHADIEETSLMLFLQPRLVDPGYIHASAQSFMTALNKTDEWLGYFGSPRFSTTQFGALRYKVRSEQAISLVLSALDGTAPKPQPLTPVDLDKIGPHNKKAIMRDEEIGRKQQEWLIKNGLK